MACRHRGRRHAAGAAGPGAWPPDRCDRTRQTPHLHSSRGRIMTEPTNEQTAALNERHRLRMERKKAVIDAKIAAADKRIGIIIVNTGNGKGKSSSAFGMVARALGHGMKVGVVQFIKGAMSTGEEQFLRRFPDEV